MKKHNWLLLVIIGIFLATTIISTQVSAIPAFARRYKISCTTCHAPIPKLKPYGDEFAGNGFIMPENEKPRDYVSAGDDLLWLNKTFPVAVRFDAFAVYHQDQEVDKDLRTPWGLKLLSGGTLYKNIGYYFYFYMSEHGEIAGIEDAYVHFNNIFNTPLDIMVGQFQTSDPLMKRELRLTLEDYQVYKTRVGESPTNLTYDRGIMMTYSIEKSGTDLVAMIVNGNGKGEADESGNFDNDANKNIGFRINQGVGDFLSVGGFYYIGKNKKLFEEATAMENKIVYAGPDLNLNVGPVELTVQYLLRKDSNPNFSAAEQEVKTKGTVIEMVFSPQLDRSRYFITGLFNKIENDYYKYQTATLSGTYLVARNLRLILEYTRDMELKKNRFAFGMVTAF
ncbi:hypothetical protein B6D60_05590 [candidate division KSB1 bacterium 4484_87]|nr:MAG: hypothetical protein B6D60_05590 [candidate division KSB1 bacterium 4484_87]